MGATVWRQSLRPRPHADIGVEEVDAVVARYPPSPTLSRFAREGAETREREVTRRRTEAMAADNPRLAGCRKLVADRVVMAAISRFALACALHDLDPLAATLRMLGCVVHRFDRHRGQVVAALIRGVEAQLDRLGLVRSDGEVAVHAIVADVLIVDALGRLRLYRAAGGRCAAPSRKARCVRAPDCPACARSGW